MPSAQPHVRARPAGAVTHVSFDVFGTCAIRQVGAPSDLFRLTGQLLAERLGQPFTAEFSQDFVEWRTEAERRARRVALREEVTLAEIWQHLGALIGPERLHGLDGPALELEAERSTLRPIAPTRERIAAERAHGRRIIFISDSPLPADFLASWLRSHDFATGQDAVYVSSEVGQTKRSGLLFRHVLREEDVRPAALLHIGDDAIADGEMPRRLGIRTEPFSASYPRGVERLLLAERPPGDHVWTATAADLACARLAQPPRLAPPDAPDKLVERFLGPFLCAFGHWVLRRAAADGVARLYFASRDARLLWTACQVLARAQSPVPDLRYLLVSRHAVRVPCIVQVSPTELRWLRENLTAATLPHLLHRVELRYEACAAEWQRCAPGWRPDAVLQSPLQWATFWKFLTSPRISAAILANAATRRRHAEAYFAAQGLFEPVPSGFVDLGWFLSCQRGLHRILRRDTAPYPLRGYYLGLKRFRLGPDEAGPAASIFRESPEDTPVPRHLAWLGRHYLLEQIVGFADHPSVKAYGPDGTVEYVSPATSVDPAHFRKIEKAVADYAEQSGACWEAVARDDRQLELFLGTLLNRLLENPSPSSVEALRQISFCVDQGRPDSDRLVEPYTWPDALRAWLPGKPAPRTARGADSRWWPEASAVATPPAIRQVRYWGNLLRGKSA